MIKITNIIKFLLLLFIPCIIIDRNINFRVNAGNELNFIPIAMATDNNYAMPTLVSIVSSLKNSNKDTYLKFYVMVSGDFSQDNKDKFKCIDDKFKNCEIRLIDMHDKFKNYYGGLWGSAMYYRLNLSSILTEEKKCIYLDGDTLVLKDLLEMYNLNISNYYVAGVPDGYRLNKSYSHTLGISNMDRYICSGSLIWNLEKLRQDNIEEKFQKILNEKYLGKNATLFPDQDIINTVCYDGITDMPFKYGSIVGMISNVSRYEKDPVLYKLVSKNDWFESVTRPVVLHFVKIKPWNSKITKFSSLWNQYLQMSNLLLHET